MNGRIYDPRLGRFLQADPFVQFAANTQSYNRYSYVLNNPLVYTDPSGYFLKKLFKNKVFRVVAAVALAYVTYGAVNTWASAAFSTTTTTTATASVTVGGAGSFAGGVATTASVSTAVTTTTLSTAGAIGAGAIAGASAGFVSGAVLSGSLQGAAKGAFTGAVFGGVGGYFGNGWSYGRVAANSVAGGVTSKINGGNFNDGFKLSLATSLLEMAAINMRQKMVAQSKLDPRNSGGRSVGFRGDGFKLGGGRFNPGAPANAVCSPLGCYQGGQGALGVPFTDVRINYAPGSWQDYLVEAYAGPHDYLNSGFWYDSANGNIRQGISTFGKYAGEALNAANVAFSTPFVAASVMPQYVSSQMGYLDGY